MGKGAKVNDDEKDGARQEMGTPRMLFDGLNLEYRFTVDACATAENAKLPAFWTTESDGLLQDWTSERVWCNPPYNHILPWFQKGWEAILKGCELVVYLVPPRTGTDWWRDYALRATQIDYFRDRIQFEFPQRLIEQYEEDGKKPPSSNADDICLITLKAGCVVTLGSSLSEIAVSSGYRDSVTGKRLQLSPPVVQQTLVIPPRGLKTPWFPLCRICGKSEPVSDKVHSSLVNGSAHPACVEGVMDMIRELGKDDMKQAKELIAAESARIAQLDHELRAQAS